MSAFRSAFALVLFASPAAMALDYKNDILPLMKQHCTECHREGNSKGSLILDNIERFKEDHVGKYKPVVPGDPDKSDLLRLMKLDPGDSDFMPRKGDPLPAKDLALIEQWIKEGAVIDASAEPAKTTGAGKAAPAAPSQEFLSWTNKEGKEIKARFMRMTGTNVVIVTEQGRSFNYPMDQLSDASQTQAKKLAGLE